MTSTNYYSDKRTLAMEIYCWFHVVSMFFGGLYTSYLLYLYSTKKHLPSITKRHFNLVRRITFLSVLFGTFLYPTNQILFTYSNHTTENTLGIIIFKKIIFFAIWAVFNLILFLSVLRFWRLHFNIRWSRSVMNVNWTKYIDPTSG